MGLKSVVSNLAILLKRVLFEFQVIHLKKVKNQFDLSICIVRTDEIGDYILWRNFLEKIRKHARFQNHKIVVIGNSAWKQLAESWDTEFVDEWVWIHKNKFLNELSYRKSIIQTIHQNSYELLLNATWSRDPLFDDFITGKAQAKIKKGFLGDLAKSGPLLRKITALKYNALFQINEFSDNFRFDFFKAKYFFEEVLEEKLEINCPSIPVQKKESGQYICLVPQGRFAYKKWPVEYFSRLAIQILQKYPYSIYLLGGPGEESQSLEFKNLVNSNRITDLTGKTSLPEMADILAGSMALISNDTAAVHFAAALNIPTLVFHNGAHYGRFLPYPSTMNKNMLCLHPETMPQDLSEFEKRRLFNFRSWLSLADTKQETAWNAVQKLI